MDMFQSLISYFCEYEFYSAMFSSSIKDRSRLDVALADCDFEFIRTNMVKHKVRKIQHLLHKNLLPSAPPLRKDLIEQYVKNEFSLPELFARLCFKNRKHLDSLQEEVGTIQKNSTFFIYSPVFSESRELGGSQDREYPFITFECVLEQDSFHISHSYLNKDMLALTIAQQQGLEPADVRTLYAQQLDEATASVRELHCPDSLARFLQLAHDEFNKIFGMELKPFRAMQGWRQSDKASVSFEAAENMSSNNFRDEMLCVKKFYLQDHIMPQTVRRYLGLAEYTPINFSTVNFTKTHLGSYCSDDSGKSVKPVNLKQWKLLQAASDTLLCVEGPPGTGKTTLLKEMIADTLVKKADALSAVWGKEWQAEDASQSEIYYSPLHGENRYSIVISSTNNKAVDNIGLELLQDIPFFSELYSNTEIRKAVKIKGSLCACLGRAEYVQSFYQNLFLPLYRYLADCSIAPEAADAARADYCSLRKKQDGIVRAISQLLELRPQFQEFHTLAALKTAQKEAEQKARQLQDTGRELEACLRTWKDKQRARENESQRLQKELSQYEQLQQHMEQQLHTLYRDLEEYEQLSSFKRRFCFLFPKAARLLKKYGSAQQIRDMLQDIKAQQHANRSELEGTQQLLAQLDKEATDILNQLSALSCKLEKNNDAAQRAAGWHQSLCRYEDIVHELEDAGFSPERILPPDAHRLYNDNVLLQLRGKIFRASLRLFEAYICLHKGPIRNNLRYILEERGSGSFLWCRKLYNGDQPYPEQRAASVRALWETFFLCFPVVTTTLHSFRKSIFPLIPNLFDTLMVDESGQIIPYYVLAPLYRARRAVFVGDVNQIEPIKNVPDGLFQEKYSNLLGGTYSRFCLDAASTQSYAALASEHYEMRGEKRCGVILDEHRRCERSIMAFSNQYIYHGVLKFTVDDDNNKLFGANLVAFDIRGTKALKHYNQAEIDACKEIVNMLVRREGPAVKQKIGIITPFAKQAKQLKAAIPEIDAGTVHVFQGAEKDYILFSCVLDGMAGSKGLSQFVGGKGNLLNVAFSRAKKQFIYVGNLKAAAQANNYLTNAADTIRKIGKVFSLFDASLEIASFPSDALCVLAGARAEQKGNGDIDKYLKEVIPHHIIDSPRLHNQILNELLCRASVSVSIISPWIGGNVVDSKMLETIKDKVSHSIPVRITFGYRASHYSLEDIDAIVEKDIPWNKASSAQAIRALRALLGDNLKYAPPSHVKLLLVDDQYLFIGSLNWLYNSGKTEQKELSCLVTSADMINYVKKEYLS